MKLLHGEKHVEKILSRIWRISEIGDNPASES